MKTDDEREAKAAAVILGAALMSIIITITLLFLL